MAAEFRSAAGVPGVGSSPWGENWEELKESTCCGGAPGTAGNRLRWNTETHTARGSGVTTTRWACASEWPTPIMHKDPEPWQQDQSQSYPSDGAEIAKIFQALIVVGSKHDV